MFRWKYIFFDLDNTLFSYEYAFEKAIEACFEDLVFAWIKDGVELPLLPTVEDWFDVFKYYSDYYWESYEHEHMSQLLYRRKRYEATVMHFGLPFSKQDADAFHELYYRKAVDYVRPYFGLYALLDWLIDREVVIGIITNGDSAIQRSKIEKLALHRYIDGKRILISSEQGFSKPAREIFDCASVDSKQSIFIGDTWQHDVVGAIDAGWQAIYLNTRLRPEPCESQYRPLAVFSHLVQVHQSFKKGEL